MILGQIIRIWDKVHHILNLKKLPPLREKVETIEILRQTNKSTAAIYQQEDDLKRYVCWGGYTQATQHTAKRYVLLMRR